jgi:hypothetical protein
MINEARVKLQIFEAIVVLKSFYPIAPEYSSGVI